MVLKYAKTIINEQSAALKQLAFSIDKNFSKIVEILSVIKGNIIITGVGKSGFIAKKIASTMTSTGSPAIFIHPTEASHGDLGLINKKDILIVLSKSGESKELSDLINFSIYNKIPIISISCNKNSNLVNLAKYNIILPSVKESGHNKLAPTSSTTMMLSLGDALALSVSMKKEFSVDDFGKFHPGGSIGSKFTTIKEVMHPLSKVPLANYKTTMKEIILKMSKKGFGCVGITDEKKNLVGIITDGDLRRHMKSGIFNKKAKDLMTGKPKVIYKDRYVTEALEIFNKEKITVLFVVKSAAVKVPIGIIHLHDCLYID